MQFTCLIHTHQPVSAFGAQTGWETGVADKPATLKLDQLHSGNAQSAARGNAIELAMFNRIMSNHRTLPLLFPLIAFLVVFTLDAAASAATMASGLRLLSPSGLNSLCSTDATSRAG